MSESIYDMNLRLDKLIVEKRVANMPKFHDPALGGDAMRLAQGEVQQRGAPDRRRLYDIGMQWTGAVKDVADITAGFSGEGFLNDTESREVPNEELLARPAADEEKRVSNLSLPGGNMEPHEQEEVSIGDNQGDSQTFVHMEDIQIEIVIPTKQPTKQTPLDVVEVTKSEQITEIEQNPELEEITPGEQSVASDDEEGLPPCDDLVTAKKDSTPELPDTTPRTANNKRNNRKRRS